MLRQSGTAAVAMSATATVMAMAIAMGSLAGCQRGVLDKDAGSGFLGPVADGGAIGPGLPGGGAGSPATTGPHRLACDTALVPIRTTVRRGTGGEREPVPPARDA